MAFAPRKIRMIRKKLAFFAEEALKSLNKNVSLINNNVQSEINSKHSLTIRLKARSC